MEKQNLQFEKVYEVKLEASDETTYIVSKFLWLDENKRMRYDAICLRDWVTIWCGETDNNKHLGRPYGGKRAFEVSLFISRYSFSNSICNIGLTFTKIKRGFNNQWFPTEFKDKNLLVQAIYDGVTKNMNTNIGDEIEFVFDKSFVLRAQSRAERSYGFGKTTKYYINGIKIRRCY